MARQARAMVALACSVQGALGFVPAGLAARGVALSGLAPGRTPTDLAAAPAAAQLDEFPYADALPFLKQHIQPSDQLLLLGCQSDLAVQLSKDGYGTRNPGAYLLCMDSDAGRVEAAKVLAAKDPVSKKNMDDGRLRFEVADLSGDLPQLEQSMYDSVLDAGALDDLIATQGMEAAKACLDASQRAVVLGNPLVSMSRLPREKYAELFAGTSWICELDGDPTAISSWYKDQGINASNIKAMTSNLRSLGLLFYVYTNIDNC